MWTSVLYYTTFEFSSKYKTILNYAILYLLVLIITSLKFLKNSENNLINSWLERNFMVLDKTIMKVYSK